MTISQDTTKTAELFRDRMWDSIMEKVKSRLGFSEERALSEVSDDEAFEEAKTPIILQRMDPQGPFMGEMNRARVGAMVDVEMEDVSNRVDTRVANAPALPKHPIYSGETMQDRRDFIRKYTSYYNQVLAFETSLNRPFVMPVSACIEA